MSVNGTFLHKYIKQYAEPEARALLEAKLSLRWANVLVIPAYNESPALLQGLPAWSNTLLILVLNRPDSDPDTRCNDALRQYAMTLPEQASMSNANAKLLALKNANHLLLIERPTSLPQGEGVGLARKIGCDSALALGAARCIGSRWIHCSDADATLPNEYFLAAARVSTAVALSYSYSHRRPSDPRERVAIQVYEQYLQHYVDGLRSAGSPYAFHTLGSCIAVDATAYAKVRGFPRRAAGEDFYLLNKLAKHGAIATPDCSPIRLSARLSQRAPFGTGPALVKLLQQQDPKQSAMFYSARCFEGLREFINCVEKEGHPGMDIDSLKESLAHAPEARAASQKLGVAKFFSHASSQCADRAAFRRQFHQWFDGFKTLKFVHELSQQWGRITFQARTRRAVL
ncbi:MAG: hypothetical protein AB8B57_07420 [Congregibacter sp.]